MSSPPDEACQGCAEGSKVYVALRRHLEATVPKIIDKLSRLQAGWDPADYQTLTEVRDLLDSLTNVVKWRF